MTSSWLTSWASADVTLQRGGSGNRACTLRNGLVSVYINPNGEITSFLLYQDGDGNFDRSVQLTTDKGYFSLANSSGAVGLTIASFYVKVNTADMVEVQYVTSQVNGQEWVIGYIMRRGVAGIYQYAIVNSKADNSSFSEARMGFRGDPDLFNYAYVNDDVQAPLPAPADIKNATTLTDATYQLSDGTVYTKYDYAAFQKDDAVHGMMGDHVGIWMITPSVEWLNGGVMRQDLTVHATETTPIVLRHFHGNHFGGVSTNFANGQSKYYGPHLIYVNQSEQSDVTAARYAMIADAKLQAAAEQAQWPYSWLRDENIKQRGTVTGRIVLDDADYFSTTKFQVILAQPGSKPMLQGEGYQFWTETDAEGNFTISNVRAGSYSLWAYALNGAATGYFEHQNVMVTASAETALGTLTWAPDRYGKILWQIGEADHLSAGYNMSGKQREYGQWDNVPETIDFMIPTSRDNTDWYYAQTHNGSWYIHYSLNQVPTHPLRLTIATAGTANVKLKVRSNESRSSEGIGIFRPLHDGSVSRSATLAGRDSIMVVDIPVSTLKKGENYLDLNIWGIPENGAGGVMYDCIKLEMHEADDINTGIEMATDSQTTTRNSAVYSLSGQRTTHPRRGIYIKNRKKIVYP